MALHSTEVLPLPKAHPSQTLCQKSLGISNPELAAIVCNWTEDHIVMRKETKVQFWADKAALYKIRLLGSQDLYWRWLSPRFLGLLYCPWTEDNRDWSFFFMQNMFSRVSHGCLLYCFYSIWSVLPVCISDTQVKAQAIPFLTCPRASSIIFLAWSIQAILILLYCSLEHLRTEFLPVA